MKSLIEFTAEASAETRRRYQREVVLFEQRAEAALFLHAGSMAGLRAHSAPDTDSGRRARRLWLFHAYQYVETINPAPAEYLEDDGADISFCDTNGADVTDAADSEADTASDLDKTFAEELRGVLRSRKTVSAIVLALLLAWWIVTFLLSGHP